MSDESARLHSLSMVWIPTDGKLQKMSGSARLRSIMPTFLRSFKKAVQQLPPEQAWDVEYLVDSGQVEAIALGLATGTVIVVTGGSFKNRLGTGVYTLIN
jgi:hypothetical protein